MKRFKLVAWMSIMAFFRYLLPYALVVGIIVGLGIGGYTLSQALLRALSAMSNEARATILAALATPVVAILSVSLTHYYSRKREIAAAQRAKKIEFYESFLEEYFGFLSALSGKTETQKSKMAKRLQEEMKDHGAKTARKLMLWGEKDTIRAYLSMRQMAANEKAKEAANHAIIWKFGELLVAIRNELGHQRRGVSKSDLLGLFINDVSSSPLQP